MIGGVLLLGALRRVVCRPRVRDAVLMGLGLAVLANSRPFEGLVVSLPVGGSAHDLDAGQGWPSGACIARPLRLTGYSLSSGP